jgi:type IV pilus assembly protein PilW
MKPHFLSSSPRPQTGFSLVELLVGVAVGMIGILIIFQTVSVWSKHAQTTTAGGDARTAGTLAMFDLERDLKLAGMGFARASSQVMGCQIEVRAGPASAPFLMPMAPVVIGTKADGSNTIDVLYGNSSFFVTEETFTHGTNGSQQVLRRGGFKAGDVVVIAGAAGASAASASCALAQVTAASNPDGVTVEQSTGTYTSFYTNASASAVFNAAPASAVPTSGTIYSLGLEPKQNHWEVVDSALRRTNNLALNPSIQDVAQGVVDLKAQYGVDVNGDSQISDTEWVNTAPADWSAVRAIRVAILVRSQQFEKDADTPYAATSASTPAASAPSWFGNAFVMRNVDGNADSFTPANRDPNNWRYYRYRVYERVIPLRNMIWGTS